MQLKVLDLPPEQDLREFAGFLWKNRIAHRVTHQQGRQQLWLRDPHDADFVLAQFQRWVESGDLSTDSAPARQADESPGLMFWLQRAPVTLVLIGVSFFLTLLTSFGSNLQWLHWFTFVDFNFQGRTLLFQSLETLLRSGEWWRWLTPIFLHFSLLHLVFNLLWTWELGRRVELLQGRTVLIALVLLLGIVSNLGQFMMTGPMFGGLSGVIFGLMGYTWLWDRVGLAPRFGMSQALMVFMLVWLLLGISGILESFGFGSIANTAHLAGLLAGLAAVPLVILIQRLRSRS